MTCPTCHRPMRRGELFFSVEHQCLPCARGEAPPQKHGFVLLDRGMLFRVCNGERIDLMTFKVLEDAQRTLSRMAYANLVQRVELETEPDWSPRIVQPENLVARCTIWMDEEGVFRGRAIV